MSFDKEVAEIIAALELQAEPVTSDTRMKLALVCFKLFDRGVGWERDRVIPIIQRMAIDPMRIVHEIRKPIR